MGTQFGRKIPSGDTGDILLALVEKDGTAARPYVRSFTAPPEGPGPSSLSRTAADLADAAHFLCLLHGRQPGVVDHAASHTVDDAARPWLLKASQAFAIERAYITQITVAAGPVPSTTGHAECENAVLAQHHALDMLAQSERHGCAVGAALALVLDWGAIRDLLDFMAERLSVEPPARMLPSEEESQAVARALCHDARTERALFFGAEQLLTQHRGFWDLLEARAQTRD